MDEPLGMNRRTPGAPDEGAEYHSYLMRLWRVRDGDRTMWRASLQDALSGETHNFASMDRLWAFLREQTGPADDEGAFLKKANTCEGDEP